MAGLAVFIGAVFWELTLIFLKIALIVFLALAFCFLLWVAVSLLIPEWPGEGKD